MLLDYWQSFHSEFTEIFYGCEINYGSMKFNNILIFPAITISFIFTYARQAFSSVRTNGKQNL